MTLIERLKEINQRMIDFSDGRDTVHTIALSLSVVLPEIIQTLELREAEIARKDKLLAEAMGLISDDLESLEDRHDGEDELEAEHILARKAWLAALEEEGKK